MVDRLLNTQQIGDFAVNEQPPAVDYYFSFISLWSYIGSLAFRDLVARRGIIVRYKPVDLYALFAAGGGKPVRERPVGRQAYRLVEMERWKAIRNIPLVTWPRFYPADPSLGHRMLLVALAEGLDVAAFAHAGLKAVWADERDVEDADTLVALADASGLDGRHLLQRASEPEFAVRETGLTTEAIDLRLFGAPVYLLRGEPFWGQDRLDLLEQAIISGRDPILPSRDP